MQFSGASGNGVNGGRPSKKKRQYVRPKATCVTPDQAEAWVWARQHQRVRRSRTAPSSLQRLERLRNMAQIKLRVAVGSQVIPRASQDDQGFAAAQAG